MLTSKQRSKLRSLANTMSPILQIGKEGVTENVISQVKDALEAREIIKVTILKNSLYSAREASDEISEAIGAEPVQVIGNKFVLYKKSSKNPKIEI